MIGLGFELGKKDFVRMLAKVIKWNCFFRSFSYSFLFGYFYWKIIKFWPICFKLFSSKCLDGGGYLCPCSYLKLIYPGCRGDWRVKDAKGKGGREIYSQWEEVKERTETSQGGILTHNFSLEKSESALPICLFVCPRPKNDITADPIGSNFFVATLTTYGKGYGRSGQIWNILSRKILTFIILKMHQFKLKYPRQCLFIAEHEEKWGF